MFDDMKEKMDWAAAFTAVGSLVSDIFEWLPHMFTWVSSFLAMVWLFLRIVQQLREMGYLKGRTARTREEDEYDDHFV